MYNAFNDKSTEAQIIDLLNKLLQFFTAEGSATTVAPQTTTTVAPQTTTSKPVAVDEVTTAELKDFLKFLNSLTNLTSTEVDLVNELKKRVELKLEASGEFDATTVANELIDELNKSNSVQKTVEEIIDRLLRALNKGDTTPGKPIIVVKTMKIVIQIVITFMKNNPKCTCENAKKLVKHLETKVKEVEDSTTTAGDGGATTGK